MPLEGLIDKYASNIKKYFIKYPAYKAVQYSPDGHIPVLRGSTLEQANIFIPCFQIGEEIPLVVEPSAENWKDERWRRYLKLKAYEGCLHIDRYFEKTEPLDYAAIIHGVKTEIYMRPLPAMTPSS